MVSTKLNLLLDVGFNREVGEDEALYWKKDSLLELINNSEKVNNIHFKLNESFKKRFSWEHITTLYEKLWEEG